MKKIIITLCLVIISYLTFIAVPYYGQLWSVLFALAIGLVGLNYIRAAYPLLITLSTFALAYHSLESAVLYFIVAMAFTLLTMTLASFDVLLLLIAISPWLSTLSLFGANFPLEIIAIFIIPIFISGKKIKIPAIAAITCLWCCIIAIINQKEIMGNIIIGMPPLETYSLKETIPTVFYDFAWLSKSLKHFLIKDSFILGGKIIGYILSRPLIIIQIAGWATTSYIYAIMIAKKKWWIDLTATFLGAGLIFFLQTVVLLIYPEQTSYDLPNLLFVSFPAILIILGLLKIVNIFLQKMPPPAPVIQKPISIKNISREIDVSKEIIKTKNLQPLEKHSESTLYSIAENLSLDDALKMQKILSEHIKTKFVKEVTALDIDIAESTKLKENESHETIVFSFNEYWSFVDKIIQRKKGKLINRAGDGAIYAFDEPDDAVLSAQDIIRNLNRFNTTINTLKSHFRIRIGINSGELASDNNKTKPGKEGDVFSKTLDIAAHLQKIAEPQTLLISEHTYKKLRFNRDFELLKHLDNDNIDAYIYKEQSRKTK